MNEIVRLWREDATFVLTTVVLGGFVVFVLTSLLCWSIADWWRSVRQRRRARLDALARCQYRERTGHSINDVYGPP